jgi:uncharacterized integral membrane protein (TIGR00698 family)
MSNKVKETSKPPIVSEDILAICCATIVLVISFVLVLINTRYSTSDTGDVKVTSANPLGERLGTPQKWTNSPLDAFVRKHEEDGRDWSIVIGILCTFLFLAALLSIAVHFGNGRIKGPQFLIGFAGVFLLATLAYTLAGQSVVKAYNLEYALWALLVGLLISHTIGTPGWMRPAVQTEFYIKTGLVLLGAEVLMSKLVALGLPGIFVAWVVTPIVLITTYIFGQKILKMESRSLNMVISADMSVCGVSAAIAAAAACKAKKEELSLAIGMSLSFTVIMMVLMPMMIKAIGMNEIMGGAWMGGTIDSTGAVAAAGAQLGPAALEVATTVKMIQNILIGVCAFFIAVYWVSYVDRDKNSPRPQVSEIWKRFPKFVIGFVLVSVIFSVIHAAMPGGEEIVKATTGSSKMLRGWFFCLAFVSIGLDTRIWEMLPYFRGGKPLTLYVCGQCLNLVLTLLMVYLMFGLLFKDVVN